MQVKLSWNKIMTTYRQLNSILKLNDKNYLVDVQTWGKRRLTGEELQQFNADFDEIDSYFNQAVADGNIVNYPSITENFNTSVGSYNVVIGHQYTMVNDYPKHPKLIYWQDRMSQDPDIIYYSEEPIS